MPFYENVFGWQTRVQSDTPEFRNTVLTAGGRTSPGSGRHRGRPGGRGIRRWQVYFRVANVDSALRGIVRLGGTVLRPAADTPFGRLAEATDPMGARFSLAG